MKEIIDNLKQFFRQRGNLVNLIVVVVLLVGLGVGLTLVRRQQTITSYAYPICGLATDLRVQGLNFPTRVAARSQVNVQVQGWRDMRLYIHGNTNLDVIDGVNQSYSPDAITPTTDQFFLLNQTGTSCGGPCDINTNSCHTFGDQCRCSGNISFTAPTQPGVYTIVANAATGPLPNNGEVCAWDGGYYTWGTRQGNCHNVGFRFLEVFGPEGTPPQASVSGPSSGQVSQSLSYSATATGTRLLGMGIFVAPVNSNTWTTIVNDLNRCNNQSTCNISGPWIPTSPGQYQVVVNAYTDSNGDNQRDGGNENCSGNPILPAGWANCGGSSRITLTVNVAPSPTPTPTPRATPTPTPTPTPRATPTPTPTPTPRATPTPTPPSGGVTTTHYRLAENLADLNTAWQPYTSLPMPTTFEFADNRAGPRQIWVQFKASNNTTSSPASALIEVLVDDPVIRGCSLDITGQNVTFVIKGSNFGSGKGTVKSGSQNLSPSSWKETEIKALWVNPPTGETFPVIVTRSDGQKVEGVCSSITQIFFSGRLFCPQVNKNSTFKGELTVREVTASAQLKKNPITLTGGILKDLPVSFQEDVVYKLGIKVEKGLRKVFNLTATKGTLNISNIILPLGDIAPAPTGDGKINSVDKAALNQQWGPVTANKNCDLNGDGVCNSFEWACMRQFFTPPDNEDEPEPKPVD